MRFITYYEHAQRLSALAETIRPASYPELESEIYLALDLDRDTLIPAPADAEDLIAESVR